MGRRTWTGVASVPAIGASLLPRLVCPICSPAYASLLSSMGLGFVASARFMLPITAALLAIAITSLFIGARKRHRFGPFWLGIAAGVMVLAGKFAINSGIVMYGGVGLLLLASIWNAMPRRIADSCAECVQAGVRHQRERRQG